MMKKLVALLMALALLCSSIGAFATEEEAVVEPIAAETVEAEATEEAEAEAVDPEECKHEKETAKVTKEPTCTEKGEKTFTCIACGATRTEEIPANGHDTGVWDITLAPAEKTAGEKKLVCGVCGADLGKTEVMPPLCFTGTEPEKYSFVEVDIPVKAENSKGIHTKGFLKEKAVVEATCAHDGKATYFCTDCGQEITITTKAGKHTRIETDWGWNIGEKAEVIKEPTCTEKGKVKYTGCAVCDKDKHYGDALTVWEDDLPALNHDYPKEANEKIDATCTTGAKLVYICTVCGHRDERPNGDKLGHSWERGEEDVHDHVIVPATCTSEGSIGTAIVCNYCNEIKPDSLKDAEILTKLDHDAFLAKAYDGNETNAEHYYFTVIVDDEDGTIDEVVFSDELTAAIAAKKEKMAALKFEPFKNADGTDKKDEEGNIIYKKVYGEMKIDYVAATCTEEGKITLTCVDCGATISSVIPATGHNWVFGPMTDDGNDWDEVYPVDCTKPGYVYYVCANGCGEKYQAEIEAKPAHIVVDEEGYIIGEIKGYAQEKANDGKIVKYLDKDYDGDAFVNIAPCHDYYAIVRCVACQQTKLVLIEGDDDLHSAPAASQNHITKAQTCTDIGYEWWNCTYCGFEQQKIIPANGHKMLNGETTKAPTCTEKGERQIYCSVCGKAEVKNGKIVITRSVKGSNEILTEEIPALGHHYVTTTVAGTCEIRGSITVKCTLCGDSTVTDTGFGHKVDTTKPVIKEAPKCTEPGKQSYWCSVCHKYQANEVIPATGHSYERDADGKLMTEAQIKAAHVCTSACKAPTCKGGKFHGTIHNIPCTNPNCTEKFTWEDTTDKPTDHQKYKVDGTFYNFVITKYPSCEESGLARYTCARCKDVISDYVLPAIPHNLQPTFNNTTGKYELKCTAVKKSDEEAVTNFEKLVRSLYSEADQMIATSIIEKLESTSSATIGSFGACKYVEQVEIKKTEYAISKTEDGLGKITLKEMDTMAPMENVYVRMTWRYQLANGDTVGFKACLPVKVTDGYFHCYEGTFKLNGLTPPRGSELIDRYVEVVVDPDADEKQMNSGAYITYGAGEV